MSETYGIDLVADVQASLDKVAALPDEDRAKCAHALWPQVLDIQNLLATLRRSGVRGMRTTQSLSEVGTRLGMSTSRVKQIEAGLERKKGGK